MGLSSLSSATPTKTTPTSSSITNGPLSLPVKNNQREDDVRLLRKRPHPLSPPIPSNRADHEYATPTQRQRVSDSGCGLGESVSQRNFSQRKEKSSKSILC